MSLVHLTDQNFQTEVIDATKPVIVDFWAPWCGPCKMMAPIFEELSGEMSEMIFAKMNVDEEMVTPQQFHIVSIPTFIVFKNGQVVEQFVGGMSKEQLKQKLQSLV